MISYSFITPIWNLPALLNIYNLNCTCSKKEKEKKNCIKKNMNTLYSVFRKPCWLYISSSSICLRNYHCKAVCQIPPWRTIRKQASRPKLFILSLSLSHAMDCCTPPGWHHRDPVAPCGNQRQLAMKDDGRLFPVIETLLMGGSGEMGKSSNKKESHWKRVLL